MKGMARVDVQQNERKMRKKGVNKPLAPQPPRQKLLIMDLLTLLTHPLRLLPVRSHLEQQTPDIQRQAQNIRQSDRPRCSYSRSRDRVDRNNRRQTKRYPSRLREECRHEPRRRLLDLLKPGVLPILQDSLE